MYEVVWCGCVKTIRYQLFFSLQSVRVVKLAAMMLCIGAAILTTFLIPQVVGDFTFSIQVLSYICHPCRPMEPTDSPVCCKRNCEDCRLYGRVAGQVAFNTSLTSGNRSTASDTITSTIQGTWQGKRIRMSILQTKKKPLIDVFFIHLDAVMIGETVIKNLTGHNETIIEVKYSVHCAVGWSGPDCNCSLDCGNGTCSTSNDKCECESGFTGEFCNQTDHCFSVDCHGGRCESNESSFTCVMCPTGRMGQLCDVKDNCSKVDCGGGECKNHQDGFECVCPDDHAGEFCRNKSNCFEKDCGSGHCENLADSYECRCNPGYVGAACDMVDQCFNVTCSSRGMCVGQVDGFSCTCDPGYTGQLCQLSISTSSCWNVSCSGRGQCVGVNESYECDCNSGYTGTLCEFEESSIGPPPLIWMGAVVGAFLGGILLMLLILLTVTCARKHTKAIFSVSLKGIMERDSKKDETSQKNAFDNRASQPEGKGFLKTGKFPDADERERSFSNPLHFDEAPDEDLSLHSPSEWDTPTSPHQEKSLSSSWAGDPKPHPVIFNAYTDKPETSLQPTSANYEVPLSCLQQQTHGLTSQVRRLPCYETVLPFELQNSHHLPRTNLQDHQTTPHVHSAAHSEERELLQSKKGCVPDDSPLYAILEPPGPQGSQSSQPSPTDSCQYAQSDQESQSSILEPQSKQENKCPQLSVTASRQYAVLEPPGLESSDSHQYAVLEAPLEQENVMTVPVPLSMLTGSPCNKVPMEQDTQRELTASAAGSKPHPVTQQVQRELHPVTASVRSKPHPVTQQVQRELHPVTASVRSKPHPVTQQVKKGQRPKSVSGASSKKLHPLSLSLNMSYSKQAPRRISAPSPGYAAPPPPAEDNLEMTHPLTLSFMKRSQSSELLAPSPGYKAPPPPQQDNPHPLTLSLTQRFKSGDVVAASPIYEAPRPSQHAEIRTHPLSLSLNLSASKGRSKSSDMLAPSPGYTAPPPPTAHLGVKDSVVGVVSPCYDAPVLHHMWSAPASSPCYAVLEPSPQNTMEDLTGTGDQSSMPVGSPCYDEVFEEAPVLQNQCHTVKSQDTTTSPPLYAVLEPPGELQGKLQDIKSEQTAAPAESPCYAVLESPGEQDKLLNIKSEQTAAPGKSFVLQFSTS